MPFGLCNAPSTFQRLMHYCFAEDLDKSITIYLDDILVYSDREDEHIQEVRKALEKLRQHQLFTKREKCEFGMQKVDYLEDFVENGCLKADARKVAAVAEWPIPICIKDVQSFLGLANYYNRFIYHFAEIVVPLTNLLQKHIKWIWGTSQQEAFDQLKVALCNPPVLQLPSFQHDFVIETDASKFAVSAALMQDTGRGLKPVQYLQKKLSSAKQRYPTHDRELLAIVSAFRRFRHYVGGGMTAVITDHKPLKCIPT